jgi:hypothetical protein
VRFKVELKSQSSTTAFEGFAALNSWVISDRPYDFRWGRNATARDYDRGVAITLNFDVDVRDVTLEELHIEVTQLVFATLSLSLETTSCVQIRSGGTTKPVARAYSTLYRLRRVLLIFFADMIHTKPRQKDGACPQVWMDGLLRIREAEFDEPALIVLNQKYKCKPHILNRYNENAFHEFARYDINPLWRDLQDDYPTKKNEGDETLHSFATFLARFTK